MLTVGRPTFHMLDMAQLKTLYHLKSIGIFLFLLENICLAFKYFWNTVEASVRGWTGG